MELSNKLDKMAPSSQQNAAPESIQGLIKQNKTTIPECYIRLYQEPVPKSFLDGNSTQIPTIDMELVSQQHRDFEQMLHATCKDFGVFQLMNHGVSSTLMSKLKHEIEGFFKLSTEEKMKYRITPGDVEGYGTVARSGGKLDWGDRFFAITNPIHRRKQHLVPELPSSLRNTLESYLMEMDKLGMKLLGMMAKALKIDLKEMEELFSNGMRSVRFNHYPPCPQPELVIGITPHSDATGITILNQLNGVDGLEIKKDGVWTPINILPDALLINTGDILEIFSNGVYHSVEHRVVVNPKKRRISIAFFINPKFEKEIGPAATSLVNKQKPPLFKTIGTEKYVQDFFDTTLNGKGYLEKMRIQHGGDN